MSIYGLVALLLLNIGSVKGLCCLKKKHKPTPREFAEACATGDVDTVRKLLRAGAAVNGITVHPFEIRTGLIEAIRRERSEGVLVVRALLAAGADVNLKAGYSESPPLEIAVICGRIEIVTDLLAAGADKEATNRYGRTPLIQAAVLGKREALSVLLQKGARVNACDEDGNNALMEIAASQSWNGPVETASDLLAAGIHIEATNRYGRTALMRAAHHGRREMLDLLLQKGARVNAGDEDGYTALMFGAIGFDSAPDDYYSPPPRGDEAVVQSLLEAGADVDAVDRYGKTVLDHTIDKPIVALIKEHVLWQGRDGIRKAWCGTVYRVSQGPKRLPAYDTRVEQLD